MLRTTWQSCKKSSLLFARNDRSRTFGRLTGKIDAMLEALNTKASFLGRFTNGLDIFNRSYDIEIKTHHRLNVCVHGETANQAIPRTRLSENIQKHMYDIQSPACHDINEFIA